MAFGFLKKIKLKTIAKIIGVGLILAKDGTKEKEALGKAKQVLDEVTKS